MNDNDIYDYQLTIPSLLLMIEGVTRTDLKLYSLVKSLSRQKGYCYATNEYLGEILGMNERNVQKYLGRLKKLGLISCEIKRAGVQTSRKIFMLDDSRKRHEIYKIQNLKKHVPNETPCEKQEIQKQIKHVPNVTPGGVPNVTGGDVPNVTPILEEYKTKKDKIKQQQCAHAREPVEEKKIAAAAFSKELKELGISDEDAIAIGNEFTEKEIMAAVSFVKKKIASGKCSNPGGMLITYLRKKWQSPHNEAPPPLVPTEDIQAKRQEQAAMTAKANKQFHEELAKTHKLKDGHTIQTMLGDLVISKPNGLSETLNYEFEWFQQSMKKYYELK